MSWLARSIANSLKIDDEDDENDMDNSNSPNPRSESDPNPSINSHPSASSPSSTSTPRGVKEDISELTKTLTRQFWGVTSFLAPPPADKFDRQPEHEERQSPSYPEKAYDEALMAGIRSDFTEIGGKFMSGISKLSNNISVSEITKIASNLLQFGAERELRDEDLVGTDVGVNEEVVAFVRNITMHPEIWLDFPVPDDEDFDDFDMSDAQQEHALTVERLVPRLAALRIELCPGYMSESLFWKIYFILLHPRLNEDDAGLLSTLKIVEARAILSQNSQIRAAAKQKLEESGHESYLTKETADLSVPSYAESAPFMTSGVEAEPSTIAIDFETEKHPVQSTEMQVVDKSVIEEEPKTHVKIQHSPTGSSSGVLDLKFEDDWLEEHSEIIGASGTVQPLTNDDDVSFSDLEEDDGYAPSSYKKEVPGSYSSTKESRDWVQLSSAESVKDVRSVSMKQARSEQVSVHKTDKKEANDWLDIKDVDVM
ncbi:hypothetical protein HS088_TW03G00008 [Tripterygium wilfordii]|uniref:BSD domain-containing protein n=1 Tax=Tripterygium wilfordii TaxID=458696 RepID=A0A7J7DTR0_TRIWF|nr:uncharacterized protein LOC119990643 [Tripterygium wilfordii]KAF5749683.1 hypothetical protein HS088_TW03G00008 [Tripterygium wilfordii]